MDRVFSQVQFGRVIFVDVRFAASFTVASANASRVDFDNQTDTGVIILPGRTLDSSMQRGF